jgi:hypothetical protein
MPAAVQVVREYARHYASTFTLNVARPVFESASDWTVITICTPVLLGWLNGCSAVGARGLNHAATANPEQGTYNEGDNMESFHRRSISRRYLSVIAELSLNQGLAIMHSFRKATQRRN